MKNGRCDVRPRSQNPTSFGPSLRLMTAFATLALTTFTTSNDAKAATLAQALSDAYATNPDLTAARARLRAIDENVALAKSQGRPQLGGTAGATQSYDEVGQFRNRGRALTGTLGASYPVYAGGRVRYAVRAADLRVMSGRADLRAVEGDVFAQAVSAYNDVIRDAAIVGLNVNNLQLLETDFSASRERFKAGDLTRTDVAQSEARLADARSQLAAARGAMVASEEEYRRVVGVWPASLEAPPPLPTLPREPDDAVDIALQGSPDLQSSTANTRATAFDVDAARAERRPLLSATATASYTNYLGSLDKVLGVSSNRGLDQTQTTAVLGLSASLPIYQGGGLAARVRQAKALNGEAGEQAVGVERTLIAQVRSAYASYVVATETIEASKTSVSANQLALAGAREEQRAGARTLIEVLNAQQELLTSQVALVVAYRDQYVAGFGLLNAMGRANTETLGLDGGALYDPLPNYIRASRSLSESNDGPPVRVEATRTTGATPVDVPSVAPAPAAQPLPPTVSETISRPPLSPASTHDHP